MESGWNFTLGRVALIYATGVILGMAVASALAGSSGSVLSAIAVVFSGLAIAGSCRIKRGSGNHAK